MFEWLDRKLKEFVTWLNLKKKPTYLDNPLGEWESPKPQPAPFRKLRRSPAMRRKYRRRRID